MKPLAASALSIALIASGACAHTEGIAITPAGNIPRTIGDVRNLSGQVEVDMKVAGSSGQYGSVGMVAFMPGARTAWHAHAGGQLLIVSEGRGWVQEEGKSRREIKAGDVVWIEPGIKHWHGATRDSRMSHIENDREMHIMKIEADLASGTC